MDINVDTAETKEAATATWWKAPAAMVLVQLFNTGMTLLSKVVIREGMFILALLPYRSLFGAASILLFAHHLYERGKWREIDWRASGWIFFNAFIGYAVPLSLYCYGLRDTTPSYAVIFVNIIPLVTFILSLILRMETLQIGSKAGSLKIAGVLLSFGGTMLISLYKGRAVHLWNSIRQHHKEARVEVASNQLRGTIFLAGSSLTIACWYLIQSKVLKVYPYKYWSSTATCLVGGFQTALLGIILRRDKDAWKLGWDLQLVTIVYSGALATAERGPAYPPMFSPLALVFTAVLDSIFIGDDITVGSLLGTTMVIAGLYLFLWAKAKEVPGK